MTSLVAACKTVFAVSGERSGDADVGKGLGGIGRRRTNFA